MDLNDIIEAIQQGQVRVTDHADEEAAEDNLEFEEICFSVCGGEIIEAYSAEHPYPRCLIFGKTPQGAPVHSVWAYDRDRQIAVLITVYRPDPALWIDWRIRRRRS